MKNILLKLNMAIIFVVVLFANISFAEIFSSIISDNFKLFDSQAEIQDKVGTNNNINGATIALTKAKLEEIEGQGFRVVYYSDTDGNSYVGLKKENTVTKVLLTSNDEKQYNFISAVGGQVIVNNEPINIKSMGPTFNEIELKSSELNDKEAYTFVAIDDSLQSINSKDANMAYMEDGKIKSIEAKMDDKYVVENPVLLDLITKENGKKITMTEKNTCIINGKRYFAFKVPKQGSWTFGEQLEIIKFSGSKSTLGGIVSQGGYNDAKGGFMDDCYVLGEEVTYIFETELGKKYTYRLASSVLGSDGTQADHSDLKTADAEWYEKIISWFIRLIGKGIQALTSLVAGEDLSIDKLVFDQYSRTNLFVFEKDAEKYGENTLVSGALHSLNEVYSLFGKIAIAIYLIILVYMGIRMLTLSTSAGKQAKYKELLLDWIRGLIILYFFPYVMRFTILLNHAFVTYIYENSANIVQLQGATIKSNNGGTWDVINENKKILDNDSAVDEESSDFTYVENMSGGEGDYMLEMYKTAESSKHIADAIVWVIMLIQVLQFLIVYLKRLITVIFLIAIFPLVSISYAIDKIGDGKSQAFNNWTKEFILQVFIQSFHAVNYVLIMGIVLSIPSTKISFTDTSWFLKIIGITYVAKGGEILRGLFAQMKGGTGQKPLDVAKAMIKTNVAISGIKSIGNVASRTFGRNSMIGHGIGMISSARDTAIERRMVRNEIKANEVYANSNVYADGTLKKPLDSLIEHRIKKVMDTETVNQRMTREEQQKDYNKNLEELAKIPPEEIERILNNMDGLTPEQKEQLQYAILAAGVHSSLKSKKKKSKAEIRREIDLEVKFRTEFGDNAYISKYLRTDDKSNQREIERLKKMRIANGVEFVNRENKVSIMPMQYSNRAEQINNLQTAIRNFRSADSADERNIYWRTILDADGDDELEQVIKGELSNITDSDYTNESFENERRLKRVDVTSEALQAINDAYDGNGGYTRDELAFYNKILDNSKGSELINNKLGTSLNEFRKAIDVEVVNHSHDNGVDFARTSEAIRRLKRDIVDPTSDEDKKIVSHLRTNFSDLKEDVLPELTEIRDENIAMQERAKKDMANLSDIQMVGRITPEHMQYLRDRESELTSKFRKQLTRGVATTAAGVTVGKFKLGTEVAVAGIATGATASGKNGNILEDVITVVPNTVKATEDVLHSAGSLPSKAGNAITTKLLRDEKDIPLTTINQSMKINDKYYRNQAALDKLEKDINTAESERKRLLNKLEEKIREDNNKRNTK